MFLVTTPNQKYWKDNEKIIFLGEWCKLHNQKQKWNKLDYQTFPHHWESREALKRDLRYINSLYEKYLKQLSNQFNQIHEVNFSARYWRIILGRCLYLLITTLYDRFRCIQVAAESKLITNTFLTSSQPIDWIYADYYTFSQHCLLDDNYNFYLFCRIIKKFKEIPFEIKDDPLNPTESNYNQPVSSRVSLENLSKLFLRFYERLIPEFFNKIVISNCYLNQIHQGLIQLSLMQMPYWGSNRNSVDQSPVNFAVRNSLILPAAENKFEEFLNEVIPESIPTAYIEDYKAIHQNSLKAFPKSPKCIVTSMITEFENFSFWVAYQAERGVKLFLTQHGGGYGSHLWSFFESHEIKISDQYLTWGWKKQGSETTTPFVSGKLSRAKKMLRPSPKGSILWVTMSLPRYARIHISDLVGPQMPLFIEEQKRFSRAVSLEVHELLLHRLYLTDYGWDEYEQWINFDPSLKLYQGGISLYDQLNKSRLCIATNNSTVYLETFAANFPTILFWNSKYIEVRDSVKSYFDDLRRVGILHDTPESAATKVNDIYDDPHSWWTSNEVQEVKDSFCYQFARSSDDWIVQWKEKLLTSID